MTGQVRVSSAPRPRSREKQWGRTIIVLVGLRDRGRNLVQMFLATRAEAKLFFYKMGHRRSRRLYLLWLTISCRELSSLLDT